MMKVYMENSDGLFDFDAVEGRVEFVDDVKSADRLVVFSNDPIAFKTTVIPLNEIVTRKTVFVATEPPIANRTLFNTFDRFHSVFRYFPSVDKGNQFMLTSDPLFFPMYPGYGKLYDEKRYNGRIGRRRVLFVGTLDVNMGKYRDSDGCKILYHQRRLGVDRLRANGLEVVAAGEGFRGYTGRGRSSLLDDRIEKLLFVDKYDIDFVLCLENSDMAEYITEKLHDGLLSGRVPLYLGCNEVFKYVGRECFVDLRGYYDSDTKDVDWDAVARVIHTMTDEQYREIVSSCKDFVLSSNGDARADAACLDLSRRIMDRCLLS